MIQRNITSEVREALEDTPVVFLNGARQVGKSTLAGLLAQEGFGGSEKVPYVTFDNATVLAAAQTDPDGYINALEGPVVIDEAQRVPDLFRAIKLQIDDDRRSGQFLLTGSANVLSLPRVSESLAGRIEILPLWPFSQGELENKKEGFIDRCFEARLPDAVEEVAGERSEPWDRILRGGYPEARSRASAKRRARWFDSYLMTILQRDVRELANIERLTELPRLLQLLAARTGTLVNYAEISRSAGLPASTLKRYMALLESTFLVLEVPAWSRNLSKRLVKSPKLFVTDSGLAAHLLGAASEGCMLDVVKGQLMESFVVMELQKQRFWSQIRPTMYHYRTSNQTEVDIVLEGNAGRLVGIEVKNSTRVSGHDFNGLKSLMYSAREVFHRGIVLYTGRDVVPFASNLSAVPIQALWKW